MSYGSFDQGQGYGGAAAAVPAYQGAVAQSAVPAPGYYPDPSVPGFVRYWNGDAWTPGTSRPVPADGEVLATPRFADRVPRPGGRYIPPPAMPQREPAGAVDGVDGADRVGVVEETGPIFLDEPGAGAVFTLGPDAAAHWGAAEADPSVRVPGTPLTGSPVRVADPGTSAPAPRNGWHADPLEQRGLMETGQAPRWVTWGMAEEGDGCETSGGSTFGADGASGGLDFREQEAGDGSAWSEESGWSTSGEEASSASVTSGGSPLGAEKSAPSTPDAWVTPIPAESTRPTSDAAPAPAQEPTPPLAAPQKSTPPTSRSTSASPTKAVARTPVAHPAPVRARFGRRLLARLVDTVPLLAVAAAVGVPLAAQTTAYLQQKLTQARALSQLTRREVDVWLIDGTVLGRVALLLGAVLLAGVLLEVVPTARTGRTLGKRLLGLRVVRTGTRQPPGVGRACGRWLLAQFLLLTVLGVAGAAAWPDRAARTTVVRG
ncbi:RDD family protein [Kitasatospora sp. NPDC006697]|uniref:RDD family protein n=1 Tax=Kitasatospora sp. NPDC006697 TaxID=3364020 RepID=UPI0036755946